MAQAHAKAPVAAARAPAQGGPPRSTAIAQRGGNQAMTAPAQNGVGGTLSGWWNGASKWASDKAEAASQAVGEAWDRTRTFAKDVGDVVRTTSVGMKDGTISVQTDLDEVLDLMPERVRQSVQLDKTNPAANRADIRYDRNTGKLAVSVPDLQVKAVNAGGVKSGPVRAQNAALTMDDAGARAKDAVRGKVGDTVAGWVFGQEPKQGAKAPPPRTQLTVGRATAQNVSAQKGAVGAKQVEVSGVDLTLEQAEKGGANAFVNVANARATGARGNGVKAEELAASGVSGHLAANGESGGMGAERLAAKGLVRGKETLGSGEVRDVRAGFTNAGGGMPVADSRADTDLRTSGTVGSVRADALRAEGGSAGAVRADGVAWNQGGGALNARARSLDVDALDTDAVDAKQLGASGLDVSQDAKGTSVAIGEASVRGLDTKAVDVASANLKNLALARNANGNTRTDVGDVRARGVQAQQGGVDKLSGSAVTLQSDANGLSASAGKIDASGIDTAPLDAASASARDLQVSSRGGAVALDAASLRADGLRASSTAVGSVSAKGVSARHGAEGTRASAGSLSASGVDTASVDVAGASAANVQLQQKGDDTRLSAADATLRGVDAHGQRVGAVSLEGAAVQRDGARMAAQLQGFRAEGVDTTTVDAASVSGKNLDVSVGATSRVSAGALAATDVSAAGHRVASLDVSGLRAEGSLEGGAIRTQGAVAALKTEGVDTKQVDASSAVLEGLEWKVTPEEASASIGRAGVEGLRTANGAGVSRAEMTDARASFDGQREAGTAHVGNIEARGLEAGGTRIEAVSASAIEGQLENKGGGMPFVDARPDELGGAMRARSAQATGIDGKEVDMTSVRAEDLELAARDGQLTAATSRGRATGVDVQTPGMHVRMGEAEVRDGQAVLDKEGIDASAATLRAQGMAFDGSFGGAKVGEQKRDPKAGGAPALDVLGLARRVDNAELQASVPLRAGELGPVRAEEGTRANVRAQVKGGSIVPEATDVRMSKPLDGPLWTEVNGVYLDPKKDGLHPKADVSGFFDQDLSKSLGGPLPSRVDALVDQAQARGAAMGGSSSGTASPVDVAGIRASGSAQLAPGKLDMGAVQADLKRERADDNAVQFQANGQGDVALRFARLLTGDLQVQSASQATSAEGLATSGAQVDVRKDGDRQKVQGAVDSVEVNGFSTRPRNR